MEAASGAGLIIGPALGSILYEYSSYTITFAVYGAILLITSLVIACTLPERVNIGAEKMSLQHTEPVRGGQATYRKFFQSARCLFTLLGCMIVQIFLTFLDSILAKQISEIYGIRDNLIGYIFMIPCLVYTLGCHFMSWAFSYVKIDRRILIAVSFFLIGVSLFLTGPSQLLKIPE